MTDALEGDAGADETSAGDFFLTAIVGLIESYGTQPTSASASVVLVLDGFVVAGRVISMATYLKSMADAHGSDPANLLRSVAAQLDDDASTVRTLDDLDPEGVSAGLPSPAYFHLADAVGYSGGTRIQLEFFRGRVDRVSGWSFGTLS